MNAGLLCGVASGKKGAPPSVYRAFRISMPRVSVEVQPCRECGEPHYKEVGCPRKKAKRWRDLLDWPEGELAKAIRERR